MNNKDDGLMLWKEWFDWDGNPWVDDDYGRTTCFFCTGDNPNHTESCVYKRAKQLCLDSGLLVENND